MAVRKKSHQNSWLSGWHAAEVVCRLGFELCLALFVRFPPLLEPHYRGVGFSHSHSEGTYCTYYAAVAGGAAERLLPGTRGRPGSDQRSQMPRHQGQRALQRFRVRTRFVIIESIRARHRRVGESPVKPSELIIRVPTCHTQEGMQPSCRHSAMLIVFCSLPNALALDNGVGLVSALVLHPTPLAAAC